MIEKVSHVSLLVPDQQEALTYYTEVLGFEVRMNEPFGEDGSSQWITVAPAGQTDVQIVLEPPDWGPEENWEKRRAQIGAYPGFVLKTDDCRKDYEELKAKGVQFTSEPAEMPWGISADLTDKYGYVHNLVEDLPME
jgi:catechol 2,3-dioxygenase-like lactoylglutathione lyase family enzyme